MTTTNSSVARRLHFHLLIVAPFGLALLLLAFFYSGCQNKDRQEEPLKPAVTLDNLQTAYGKSMKRAGMYELFVRQAQKEKNTSLANLYRAIAQSEHIHAQLHARLLRAQGIEPVLLPEEPVTVGTTLQTLKMAQSSEELEYASMYPNLARTAEVEKFTEAKDQFLAVKDADARHGDLIKEALARKGKIARVPYFVCSGCGYITTSALTEECPTCHARTLNRS